MRGTAKLFLLLISAAASAQAGAVAGLPGWDGHETLTQTPVPVPQAAQQPLDENPGYADEGEFLVKREAEHNPGAGLFNPFYEGIYAKRANPRLIADRIPYLKEIKKESDSQGVDIRLILALIQKESSFDPAAYNRSSGAVGLMQVLPSTARAHGLKKDENLWKPAVNIKYGVKYFKHLWKKLSSGDLSYLSAENRKSEGFINTLAAYNAGPGNVRKYKGVPPFKETRDFIKLVTEYFTDFGLILASLPGQAQAHPYKP